MIPKKFLMMLTAATTFLSPNLLGASELSFKFTNPSFGGDPLYGGFLLQQASMQNKFKEETKPLFTPPSPTERFTDYLTNQFLYRFADAVMTKIFGDGSTTPQIEPGRSYTIGGLSFSYNEVNGLVIFTIKDLSTGQETVIQLPKSF